MKSNFSKSKTAKNAMTLVEGEIVDLSRKAVLFSQHFCRCFSPTDCLCAANKTWIPKSLIMRSKLYDRNSPATIAGLDLWEKGAAKFLIPTWKFQEIINSSQPAYA